MNRRSAFTLVETLVAIVLATCLIILVMQLSGIVRTNVTRGGADLKNLQTARAAVNCLRRDFLTAIPMYVPADGLDTREQIRGNPIETANQTVTQQSQPIIVSEHAILFFSNALNEAGNKTVKKITWAFDPENKALVRNAGDRITRFPGIEKASFARYYHPLNQRVPMIWVNFSVKSIENGESKELALATTIASAIISQDINNPFWNWTGQ